MNNKTEFNEILTINFKRREPFVILDNKIDIQIIVCMYVLKNYLVEEPRFIVEKFYKCSDGLLIGEYLAPFYSSNCGEVAVCIAVAAGKLDPFTGDLLLNVCKRRDFAINPDPEDPCIFKAYNATEKRITQYIDFVYSYGCCDDIDIALRFIV